MFVAQNAFFIINRYQELIDCNVTACVFICVNVDIEK